MKKQRHSVSQRSGNDRFGYRPSPEKRPKQPLLPQEQALNDKQRLLDKIKFDQLEREWLSLRAQKGHDAWRDFGNKALPIEKYRHDIMKTIATNRISLLSGETGSGKSTQLAQYALEMGYDRIVYLQPRRVTTDAISERLDAELTEQFESRHLEKPEHLVGMAHSERATIYSDSMIQVMTSAVFKKRAAELRDVWQDEHVLIVADEVHEGNIETEFAVATAAELMPDRPEWNMVLMSATLNEDEVQQAYQPINGKPIPTITVEGRPHTIEQHECPNVNVVDVFDSECFESGRKTLIFTDGKRSVKGIMQELKKRYGDQVRVLPLHSKIDEETRRAIFDSEDVEGVHTVIVSTSAGQSGLTIKGLDRVISDGCTKSPELDDENAEGLPRRLCSRDELIQQMGRGGRDVPGGKFFLAQPFILQHRHTAVAPEFVPFDSHYRLEHIPPDIYHTVISRNVLSAAAMDRDFYDLNEYLIHKVTVKTIKEAYAVLQLIGAVDDTNSVTEIGHEMDKYPLRPELARAFVESLHKGTLQQQHWMAMIATAVEAGGLAGYDIPAPADEEKEQLRDDFLAEVNLFVNLPREIDEETGLLHVIPNELVDSTNVVRAAKQYKKVCLRSGLDGEDESFFQSVAAPNDVSELRQYLLTGMPHLLYAEVGRKPNRGRQKLDKNGEKVKALPIVWYRNILAPSKEEQEHYSFDRQIGKRSVLAAMTLSKDTIIAGYPRWFETEDGVKNVIERGFPVRPEEVRRALGKTALDVRDWMAVGKDGRLYKKQSGALGQLAMYDDTERQRATSEESTQLLMQEAMRRPYPALKELLQLKRLLQDVANRVPKQNYSYYFEKPLLTDDDIEKIVHGAAQGAGSIGELDANIRVKNIQFEDFMTREHYEAVIQNMPSEMSLAGETVRVHYLDDSDVPLIYEFPLQLAGSLPDDTQIPDGRAVRFRYKYGPDDERILTAAEVKAMAKLA